MYRNDVPHKLVKAKNGGKHVHKAGLASLYIEVKAKEYMDPFIDHPIENRVAERFLKFDSNSIKTDTASDQEACLGQIITYASKILSNQYRTHTFSIIICGPSFRFIYWDRSGAVVTESFNCRKSPEILASFCWRFSHASPAVQGHDLTVRAASSIETDLFAAAIKNRITFELDAKATELSITQQLKQHFDPKIVHVIRVGKLDFVVSCPVVVPNVVAGRATRGYWAYNLKSKTLCFLKESWRILKASLLAEGEILEELNQANVMHVPKVIVHEDLSMLRA